jgi:hypothetical protein
MKAIVYTGPHYGCVHSILARDGRRLLVKHALGVAFWVHVCDVEIVKDASVYNRHPSQNSV